MPTLRISSVEIPIAGKAHGIKGHPMAVGLQCIPVFFTKGDGYFTQRLQVLFAEPFLAYIIFLHGCDAASVFNGACAETTQSLTLASEPSFKRG
jgi:hypothetical protein